MTLILSWAARVHALSSPCAGLKRVRDWLPTSGRILVHKIEWLRCPKSAGATTPIPAGDIDALPIEGGD